ncbi:hypothetical protein [Streptomyces griseoluteus]
MAESEGGEAAVPVRGTGGHESPVIVSAFGSWAAKHTGAPP